MGLSLQRPHFRAWEQDSDKVRRWASRQFPNLRAYAKKTGAKVYFADEAAVRSDHPAGTTWAERGKTPVVRSTGQRFSGNMISAISPEGTLRFMVTERRMNLEWFCEFLERLMHGESGNVLLIVDGHPARRAKATREHLAKFAGRLHLYLLPGHSPELNPDKHVWNWIKNHEIGRKLPKNKSDLVSMDRKGLASLQRRTETLRGFFHDPHLKYIKSEHSCTA